jgi:hypothetical protein
MSTKSSTTAQTAIDCGTTITPQLDVMRMRSAKCLGIVLHVNVELAIISDRQSSLYNHQKSGFFINKPDCLQAYLF